MVKRLGKRLSSMVLAVLILILCCVSALAAPSGSIRVMVQDSHSQPVQDFSVELIRVAELVGGVCTLEPEFAELGLSGEELMNSLTPETAQAVYQCAYASEMEGIIKITSAEGVVEFGGLREGVYLVFEYGDQAVAFEPFLVTIPSQIGGRPEYQVISMPKTSETDVRTLVCMKVWEDDMNAAGKRPESLLVTVLRDGVPYRSVTLSADNSWQHKFYMLPESGTYTVEEAPVADYVPEYVPVAEGYIIINRYTGTGQPGGPGGGGGGEEPDLTHVSVSKVWDDNDNANGKRPDSITVQLIADDVVLQTAVLSEANHWKYTFYGLDGSKSYTVTEIAVPEFSASYSGNASNGIVITNRHVGTTDPGTPPGPVVPEPKPADIPVRVEWVDQNDQAGKRPGSVIIYLLADGAVVRSLTLDPACGWEGVFAGVDGDLSYTIWQSEAEDYTTTYAGNAAQGFVATNTYTEGITDPGLPLTPTTPIDPEEPLVPIDPEEPAKPFIPQTGAEVLPVYLLMAAGVLLVLLGLVDLCRGQRCYEEED